MTELLGITEIAERLKVPRNTVDSWRKRGKLPLPDTFVGIHPLWEQESIEKWWKGR